VVFPRHYELNFRFEARYLCPYLNWNALTAKEVNRITGAASSFWYFFDHSGSPPLVRRLSFRCSGQASLVSFRLVYLHSS